MSRPLAYVLRPTTLDEVVGQQHLIGEHKILRKCIEKGLLYSMIFYGPPGTGKTTLATVLANSLSRPYRLFNAVTGNKKELDAIFTEAKMCEGLVLIVDEVHRLNKDKQDLLLPHVENGNIILIGATTANPFHSINPAIRSRCHLFEVKRLQEADIIKALQNALQHKNGLQGNYQISEEALLLIAQGCGGDIRFALNTLELASLICEENNIRVEDVRSFAQLPNHGVDKDGDGHYDLLSGFQKSIRGSDVHAALYYLAQLIIANDMPSIERRLLTIAYEDIGLANPAACARCVQAIDAALRIGFPEGRIPLANAVIDLCLSPKSKSAEAGIDAAMAVAKQHSFAVPPYLRYTPVNMREEDQYDYGRSDIWDQIQYMPEAIKDLQFYTPQNSSQYEKVLGANYEKLSKIKRTSNIAWLKKK